MTTSTDSSSETAGLQFDRAEQQDGAAGMPGQALVCSRCQRPMTMEYYQVGDAVACADCKAEVVRDREAAAAQGRRASGLARAMLFGLGAAVAGAAIYYAVIAITEWELAIVALLIGYMVGWAVRRGSRGVGGRRYQWTALVLTYLSVGMAYTPVAFKALMDAQKKGVLGTTTVSTKASTPATPSTTPATPTTSTTPTASTSTTPARAVGKRNGPPPAGGPVPWAALAIALLAVLAASLLLPLAVVFGTLPGGILNAVIIGVGMQQAWKMTRAPRIPVSGPYRLGGAAP